jgi:integrase
VSVSVKGNRVTRLADNLTIARETESAIKGDLVRDEFDINHHRANRIPTLNDLWEKYLPWAKEHKRTWKIDQYNYQTHLQPRFGSRTLDSVTNFDVEKLKIEMKRSTNKQGRPYTAATIKHQLVLLKRLYTLAKRWGLYLGDNPMDRVEVPRLDNQKTEYLSDEETERLMKALDAWPCADSAAFVRFALYTGMRRGELFKLTWDDVDFERSMIRLREPKGGKSVTIPVSLEAMAVLKDLQVTSTFVFPGKNGEMRTDFKGPWQRIRKAAGLPDDFRFHGLRHNFASALVSSGVDLAVVRELLTHKDTRTSARYSHLRPDAIRDAARKSGNLLSGRKSSNDASTRSGRK